MHKILSGVADALVGTLLEHGGSLTLDLAKKEMHIHGGGRVFGASALPIGWNGAAVTLTEAFDAHMKKQAQDAAEASMEARNVDQTPAATAVS